MDIHQNARLTPHGRAELVRRVLLKGQAPKAVAAALGVNVKTVNKWCERFQAEGAAGLLDRSSRPHRLRQPTPDATVEQIAALRRQRWTGEQIAKQVGVSPATVSRVLRRLGLSRMKDLAPAAPIRRYERANPGELLHIDIKKLARFDQIGHRITGRRSRQSRGAAGSSSTSASTTPRASPSPRSCPTSARRARSPSCKPPWPTMRASASPSPGS